MQLNPSCLNIILTFKEHDSKENNGYMILYFMQHNSLSLEIKKKVPKNKNNGIHILIYSIILLSCLSIVECIQTCISLLSKVCPIPMLLILFQEKTKQQQKKSKIKINCLGHQHLIASVYLNPLLFSLPILLSFWSVFRI